MSASVKGQQKKIYRSGFTLIELAIVLVILGLLLGGGAMLLEPALDNSRRSETKAKLKVIEDALTIFAATKYLPCPSDPTLGSGSSLNGLATTPGGGFCTSTFTSGGVPWRTLGLSETDVIDGWGRRISYAVTNTLTVDVPGTPPTPPLDCNAKGFSGISKGKLENRGANNAAIQPPAGDPGSAKAAYILVSHGENRWGGYLPSGAQTPVTSASTTELVNIKAPGGNGLGGTSVIYYYEKLATTDTIVGFDDIVRGQTSSQIAIALGCTKP